MRTRSTRHVIAITAMAAAAALVATVLVAPQAWSVDQERQSDTTIATADDGGSSVGNILPRPDSGQAPDSPNDPGGWQQYLVFALIFAGLGAIVVLATRESRRARAERDHASTA